MPTDWECASVYFNHQVESCITSVWFYFDSLCEKYIYHHRHHRPHRLWANFIFAIPNAIKLCCTTHCLSVDFAIGNGRKENLLGFNSKMKKKNQIVDLTCNLNTLTTNGARHKDLARRKYFWCLENSGREFKEYLTRRKYFWSLENSRRDHHEYLARRKCF